MNRLTRDGTAEPVSRDQIFRHARGQGNVHFPCSADHEQDWQPYPVDPYSAICDDDTVAAWVYDGAISSGVNRRGMGVHCIVGVLGSATTRYVSVITHKGEGGCSHVVNGTPRRLASLLRETNYASLTTKCLTMAGTCTEPNPRPTTEWTSALLLSTTQPR